MSVVQALLIALFVAAVESRALGYATLTMRFSPLMAGFVVGLVLGNMPLAMTTVATIQLIYMGVVAPGGAMPSEPCIASAMAVSTVIVGNLKPEASVAIAVPVGLLGSYLYQLRFFLNTFAITKMDACAVKADSKGLAMWIGVMPTIFSFVLFVPLMFVALYLGAPVVSGFMDAVSNGPVLHVLSTVGGGLAALGIAITMHVIGNRKLLPFFFLAYFMQVFANMLNTQLTAVKGSFSVPMIFWAIIGVIIAVVYEQLTEKSAE